MSDERKSESVLTRRGLALRSDAPGMDEVRAEIKRTTRHVVEQANTIATLRRELTKCQRALAFEHADGTAARLRREVDKQRRTIERVAEHGQVGLRQKQREEG